LRRQRDTLRPLGWAAIVVVTAGAIDGHPAPGLHGKALGVTLALCVFAATLAVSISDRFPDLADELQATIIALMGAAGVALAALDPRQVTGLAAGAGVWMAVARLPPSLGIPIAAAITAALAVAEAIAGVSSSAILATTLLCALLGLIARFMKQARASQDRTELLLAELEDAREEQTRAAAIAERGRIASELHDLLAHSLSGAAIQLQGARLLADREHAGARMRAAIDRASELVREGLANARQAVGTLRGDELPSVAQLESLIASFRDDMNVDVSLTVEGSARTLPADASLALYRGAQEALTNVARYAPGAITSVMLRYEAESTSLTVEDTLAAPATAALSGVGGGRGLAGMRERIERVGGSMQAGPTDRGWRVDLVIPG
jgi:signal transduction histidine kinase